VTSAGVPQVATAPIAVTLASSSPGGRFALGPAGPWTSTLSVTIPTGGSSPPPFHYADTRAAQPQVSAAGPGVTTATQVETVAPGAPAGLRIDPAEATLEPYRGQRFAATAVDAFENPVGPVEAWWTVTPSSLGVTQPGLGSTTTVTAGGRGGSGRLTATIEGNVSGVARLKVGPGTVRVASIRYERRPRSLRVTATVVEARGAPARAVRAAVTVRRNGREVFSGQKRTDVNGLVTYLVPLEKGCYRTTVTGVTGPGYSWNARRLTNRFCAYRGIGAVAVLSAHEGA
jgi:hypothetical protein